MAQRRRKRYLDNVAPVDNRIITIGQIPRGYVDSHGDMVVRTPKGIKTTLQEAYKNYNQTPVAVENIPGLTDYLIKQDNQDIQEAAHMRKRAGDRFVHQLGEERDKALMTIAAGALGGGALASGLALAPVATLGSIGGGMLGEKAWNRIYGNTWGQDVEHWTNGYIPAYVGEYLNPGSLIGGGLGSQVGKVPSLAYQGFLRMPQTKRAVEVAMRTTATADPIEPITSGIKSLYKNNRQQLKDVGKYILTGKRTNSAIDRPYRTLATPYNSRNDAFEYTGFNDWDVPNNDIIDAYLYGKQIDPRMLRFVSKGKDFGLHADYVSKNYSNKAKDIQVYEGGLGDAMDYLSVIKEQPNFDYGNISKVKGTVGTIRSLHDGVGVNSAGHIVGLDTRGTRLSQDIWKFNPSDYNNRWGVAGNMKFSVKDFLGATKRNKIDYLKRYGLNSLKNFGLKVVDDIGTPVIIRSKPFRYKTMNEIFRDNIAAAISRSPDLANKPLVDFMPLMPTKYPSAPLYNLFK